MALSKLGQRFLGRYNPIRDIATPLSIVLASALRAGIKPCPHSAIRVVWLITAIRSESEVFLLPFRLRRSCITGHQKTLDAAAQCR